MFRAFSRLLERVRTGEVARDGRRRLCMEGRDVFKYSDGDRSVFVQAEVLGAPVNRVVYAGVLTHWLPPHETEAISAEQRSQIVTMVHLTRLPRSTRTDG